MASSFRSRRASAFRPRLEGFEDRVVPAIANIPVDAIAVGPDDGGIPRVKIIDPATGEDVGEIEAYETAFRGGVRTALGDVTGDGVNDLVIAPGPGGGPRVRLVDGTNGATLADFFVYEPTFTGGLYVAVGDVNGDGRGDVITGTGNGGGPRVRVLDGATLGATVVTEFFAYESTFRGGVLVAAGDVDGDGDDDVITGTGVGGGPRVTAFDAAGRTLQNFFAFEDSFRGGVRVSAGDIDGDGRDDIIAGTGPTGGPVVRVVGGTTGADLFRFLADDSAFRGGVGVGSADVDGDGRDDLISRVRRGNEVVVRVFSGAGGAALRQFSRTVDDSPGGGGGSISSLVVENVEGTLAAVDVAARRVTIRLVNGTDRTFQLAAGTKVERNEESVPLAALVVGERGEVKLAADGSVLKVESGVEVSGGGGGGSTPTAEQIEGTVTAVDPAARRVTIRLLAGTERTLQIATSTEVERNDESVPLSAFRVGDRGEARVAADGRVIKIEAEGP